MKKLITTILLTTAVAQASVIPVDGARALVADELFPYQWGLLNEGQTLVREKDDIHNLPLKGVSGKDIGWSALAGAVTEKRPIIAVLDSGVDLNHPELQGNLWKNVRECGKDPKVDNDGNQLAGDCHGWNFTESIEADGAKDPGDLDGHGTHISGIIGALNNGVGMTGVVPNALIMPIKVMKDSNSTSTVPSSESFARGIVYAVDNGADVINMSLGWPRALETKLLRDAVNYALSRNIPIVAAAGNNNSSEPLYPCAYDGVICVGATTIDGRFASFSNFGGHVDTAAPGEGILGLHPTALEPDFFAVAGFELRSGTSQAAPLVAGLIAAVKAREPNLTIDDLFARLYQARALTERNKYVLGGAATFAALSTPVEAPVLRPVFKRIRQLTFRGDSRDSKLAVTIRNFGLPVSDISVRIESLSPVIAFSAQAQRINALNRGEFREVQFDVNLRELNGESEAGFRVIIEQNGITATYTNEVPVVRDLRSDPNWKRLAFSFADRPVPLGTVREGALVPLLSTVESWRATGKHEFYLRRTLREEKKQELTIFTKTGNLYQEAKKKISIDALSVVNFLRADLNFDGKEDYVVQSIGEKDGTRFFQFSFFNESLDALWPGFQHVRLNLDLFVERLNDILLVQYQDPARGKILVPAFFTKGMLPRADQPITTWERLDPTRKKRLYFLEPAGDKFNVRALTTNVWEEQVKKDLSSRWFETVETEQVLPASEADRARGVLRVLLSVGIGTRRQLFIQTYDTKAVSRGPKLPQLVLQSEEVDSLFSLTPAGLSVTGDVYFNVYDRTRAKLVFTRTEGQLGEFVLRHETEADVVAGHVASFDLDRSRFSVIQSREELIAVTAGATQKRSTRPKLRYSFLSQRLLSELYFPVTYTRGGQQRPALFVDATPVTGNRVYLFEEQNGDLVSSIRNSVVVPSNCRSLNPVFNPASGAYEYVFLCLEDNTFAIRTYELN